MKKIVYILLFVVVFSLNSNAVLAEEHIVSIENIEFTTGGKLNLSGYSFISDMDNNGSRNLDTYIIAYKGNEELSTLLGVSKDSSCLKNGSNCNIEVMKEKCSADSKICYIKNIEDSSNRDMFYARCYDDSCGVRRDPATSELRKSCNSNCTIYDVGFNTTLNLETIYNKFSGGVETSVKFAVISVINNDKLYVSGLYAPSTVCKAGNSKCNFSNSGNNVGNFNIKLNLLTDTAYFTAGRARVYKYNSGFSSISGTWFKNNDFYRVISNSIKQSLKKNQNGIEYGSFEDILYQLDAKSVCSSGYCYEPDTDNSSAEEVYALRSWLSFASEFVITGIKPNLIKYTCNDIGYGSNNVDTVDNCNNDDVVGQLSYCSDQTSVSFGGQIFYPATDNVDRANRVKIGNNYYVNIQIYSPVILYQEAKFNFGNILDNSGTKIDNLNSIKAGKGFELSNSYYNNTSKWYNSMYYADGTPYYSYSAFDWVPRSNGTFIRELIDIDDTKTVYYCLSENGCSGSDYKSGILKDIADDVVNFYFKTKIVKEENVDKIEYFSCDSNNSSNCSVDNLKKVEGSWTKSSSTDVSTSSTLNGIKLTGGGVVNEFVYKLANSSVVVKGDDFAKALYAEDAEKEINNARATGNKFYIDFKWVYGADYPFNLALNINPSFLPVMGSGIWNLNGQCSINVEDGYYRNASGDGGGYPPPPGDPELNYRYRSINVSDPFPKAKAADDYSNVAINWRDWYFNGSDAYSNQNRIKNTYDFNPVYMILISKNSSDGDKVKISEINNVTTSYKSIDKISIKGVSDFVRNNFSKTASNESYCELGLFSKDCDVDWGIS